MKKKKKCKKCDDTGEIGYYKNGEFVTEPCPECKGKKKK